MTNLGNGSQGDRVGKIMLAYSRWFEWYVERLLSDV